MSMGEGRAVPEKEGIHDFEMHIGSVVLAHRNDAPPGFSWNDYRLGRKVWGVTYIVSGRGEWLFQDGSRNLYHAGQVIIFSPDAAYRFFVPMGEENCLHYTINFTLGDRLDADFDTHHACAVTAASPAYMQNMFRDCVNLYLSKQPGYRMLVFSNLYRIIYEILTIHMRSRFPAHVFDMVRPAQEYLQQHYAEEITLEPLASLCSLSPTHFRRLFRSVFGCSPISYLQTLRIEHAKDLLLLRDLTVEWIAMNIGFQSSNYFIRCFKQHTGLTPMQYRRSLGGGEDAGEGE